MARRLLREWDIAEFDLNATDTGTVQQVIQGNPIALSVTDDAMIAVAFAAVKLRGCCDGETRKLALKAIAREQMTEVFAERGWEIDDKRRATLDLMATTLTGIPEK